MSNGISRRDLFKLGGTAAIGVAGAGALASCAPTNTAQQATVRTEDARSAGHRTNALPEFLEKPDPITEFVETKNYDVVVIGAGAAGVPAALAACEAGATVALLQKEPTAISQGNSGSGIDMASSDAADVERLVSQLLADSQHRADRALVDLWAKNSGEAVKWVIDRASRGGAQVVDQEDGPHKALLVRNDYRIRFVTSFFGPKPYTAGDGMRILADVAAEAGVDIFYSTPAVQIQKENEQGAVTGVVAKGSDGPVLFNAAKGVIVATGDYQNDDEMRLYYQPDLASFTCKQSGKTGDGHKMIVWAGGKIEDIAHTKMLHDFDAGPASMCDMPFLTVKNDGTRFVDETVSMSLMNNYLRSENDQGWYSQIFDANYMEQAADWPGKLYDPEALKVYMPEEDVERTGVFADLVRTFKADTLEELAVKLEITDVDAFVATVKRYNELAYAQRDEDFGKPARFLKPVETPPFYGIHRWVRISAICSGVDINERHECLTPDGEVIENLYAIGNCAGHFYGGIDYPLTVFGMSLGRCYTEGYVIGRMVAEK